MAGSLNPSVMQFQHPRFSIPPPLMMSEPGSFAHVTLTQRWPAIVKRISAENSYSADILANLETLVGDLSEGTIRVIQEDAPDTNDWRHYLERYVGEPWLNVPWLFAEIYFYRRILEAVRYFQPGQWHHVDPFWHQKQTGLETAIPDIQAIATQPTANHPSTNLLLALLYSGLWGNRADLSLRPDATAVGVQAGMKLSADQTHILVDDSSVLIEYLTQQSHSRIDVVADNAGFELVCDLFLMDGLLANQMTQTVWLHLKNHPTFVSDATIADVHHTIETLAADPVSQVFAERLRGYLRSEQLQLKADPFWTAPLVFWQMPSTLQTELADANVAIIKGMRITVGC